MGSKVKRNQFKDRNCKSRTQEKYRFIFERDNSRRNFPKYSKAKS